MSSHRFVCVDCGQEKIHVKPNRSRTGYGIEGQGEEGLLLLLREARFCRYAATGRAVLYLTEEGPEGAVVTNWPGILKFRVRHKRVGSHNLAGRRVDVWFTDSDGREWHGVNYGHNSQLCHCRRLRGMMQTFALILCAAGQLRGRSCPTLPAGHSGALPRCRWSSRPVALRSRPVATCCP